MKIKNLIIRNYGPLEERSYQFSSGFNLLFGKNEQGKSLTFDALVKLLFGKNSKIFDSINRVEDDPASFGSFVTVANTQNKKTDEFKLQGKNTLADVTGLSATESKNLFLIRNSDLSIGKDLADQEQFYTSITDRLTGLQTKEIAQTRAKILDYAQLTDTGRFQSTQENQKLGERVEKASALLSTEGIIHQLIEANKTQEWSLLEEKLFTLKSKLKENQESLSNQKLAQQLQEYQQSKTNLNQLESLEKQLLPLEGITQEQLDLLRLSSQEKNRLSQQKKEIQKELEKKQKKAEQVEKELLDLEKQIAKQSPIKEEIDNYIQPESINLIKQLASLSADQATPWEKYLIYSGVLFLISLLAFVFSLQTLILIIVFIFLLISLFLSLKSYQQIKQKQLYDTNLNQLKLRVGKYQIKIKNLDEIDQQILELKTKFNQLLTKQSVLKVEKKSLRDDIGELQDKKLSQVVSDLLKKQETIDIIFLECNIKSIEELKKKLDQKYKIQTQKQKVVTLLEAKFGKSAHGVNQMTHFQKQLNIHKHLDSQIVKEKYNPQLIHILEQSQQKNQQDIEILQNKLSQLHEKLKTVQREVELILPQKAGSFVIDNMNDLFEIKQQLKLFINQHSKRRQNAIKLIRILKTIEVIEKKKVGELFGENSIISQRFKEITKENYSQVYYDQEDHQIKVELKSGKLLLASQLSSGTYDQLYLAIRLGLGEKLLNKKTGFFIMDDPFLKSDSDRLKKQLEILLNLSKAGWQVIYFSAKNEVRDYIKTKKVKTFIVGK